MGYPTKTTLAIAVDKGNLFSFPGAQINKYYFVLDPSVKGHPTQERQGMQASTLQLCSRPTDLSPSGASNDAFPYDSILQQISYLPSVFSVLVRFLAIPLDALLLLLSAVTIIFLLFTVMIAIRSTLLSCNQEPMNSR